MPPYIRVEINQDLCQPCQRLLGGVLNSPPASDDRDWESQLLDAETVRCFKTHHPSFSALLNSAREGCKVCMMTVWAVRAKNQMSTVETLHHFAGGDLTYHFWLPKLLSRSSHCDLAFGIGEVSEHGRGGRRPMQMELYRRNGDDSLWNTVDLDDLFKEDVWPTLAPRANLNSGSEESVQRSTRWLLHCIENHAECDPPPSPLPKRVLDLTISGDPDTVRLYETRGEIEPFVALSYSWGMPGALTTVRANLEKHRVGIPVAAFPRTLREAILFTKSLGLRYLWIDALCIIQDDADDWAEQAACMIDVYGASTLTLSATSSYDCDHGLFGRMTEPGMPVGRYYYHHSEEQDEVETAGHGTVFLDPQGSESHFFLEKEYLSTRGWTFQERLVAPRTIHFTDNGIVWECAKGKVEEGRGTLWGVELPKKPFADLIRRGNAPDAQSRASSTRDSTEQRTRFQRSWHDWISDFSNRKLTKVSDKLPAVAGVAKAFAARFDDRYIAGLWESRFLEGLVWTRFYKALSLVRHEASGLPSWSWASVSGRLQFSNFDPDPAKKGVDMVIHEINVVEKRIGSYGEVHPGGYIRAEGMLQLVTLDRQAEMRNPDGPHHPCSISHGLVPGVDIECWMDQMEFENPEEPYECWCLRVCSHDREEMIEFLFLEQLPGGNNQFRRIGAGVTEVLAEKNSADPAWDSIFISGTWTTFQLL